eukprot:TRINITY_DN38336_c0_g2_i2.p1 TRINITY_DN38336_c0_g2~~TRINITY_DN38336_c0_g2_i2.p1  ORF type:complete len:432 (+),score=86.41 TRINITY_DN38336_c0_g2_i2:55-1350(+)
MFLCLLLCSFLITEASLLSLKEEAVGADGITAVDAAFLLQRGLSLSSSAAKLRQQRAVARDALLEGGRRACRELRVTLEASPEQRALQNIRWVHIPKTGTSFIATIWNYACGQREPPLDLGVSPNATLGCVNCYDWALMDRYPSADYCQPGLLSAEFTTSHAPITRELTEKEDLQVIGFFRRPSQRLISAYYNGLHANGFTQEGNRLLVEECGLNGRHPGAGCYARYPGIAGCSARMLTGATCAEPLSSSGAPSSFDGGRLRLSEALKSLDAMAFVGLTERWDESVCLFHRMFGGRLSTAQLLDMHMGRQHQDRYDEAELEGFVDEVDEEIYRAAEKRFEALLAMHVAAGASACGELLGAMPTSAEGDPRACSCAAQGRECGVSRDGALNCGRCPPQRLAFQRGSSEDLICQEEEGICLHGNEPNHGLFSF